MNEVSETVTRAIAIFPGSAAPVLTEIVVPEAGEHQAAVRLIASGICHSQLNHIDAATHAAPGSPGRLLGHEALGVVESVGPNVRSVQPGQTVIMSWIPRKAVLGTRKTKPSTMHALDGRALAPTEMFTWCDRTVADEAYLYPANSTQPVLSVLGCAVVTGAGAVKNSARVRPGETVAVIGAGGVGGSAIAAARVAGAGEIIAIDMSGEKLALAQSLGATHLINAGSTDVVAVMEQWSRANGTTGVDFVIDCVATAKTFSDSLAIVRKGRAGFGPGGTVIVVGVAHKPAPLDLRYIQWHGIGIKGCFGGDTQCDHDFALYADWFFDKTIGLQRLVTHTYGLHECAKAVQDLKDGKITGRGMFTMGPDPFSQV